MTDDDNTATGPETDLESRRHEREANTLADAETRAWAVLEPQLGFTLNAEQRANMLPRCVAAYRMPEGTTAAALAEQMEADSLDTLALKAETAELNRRIAESERVLAECRDAEIDVELEQAHYAGKLRYARDDEGKAIPSLRAARLRRIGREQGLDALRAELDEIDATVPLRKRQFEDGPAPERHLNFEGGVSRARRAEAREPISRTVLQNAADQLGMDVKDLEAEYAAMENR